MSNQVSIPGTEREYPPEVRQLADRYVAVLDERMAITHREADARAALIDAMERHDCPVCIVEDMNGEERRVSYEERAKIKVSRVKAPADDVP